MPYSADKPGQTPDPDELRRRIPGWGADLDPADRPAFPREQPGIETRAHWDIPEQQPEGAGRERSIEHQRLTPVFGTAQPLHGLSGGIRRIAYARYSEGQTPRWMLLILGDRVESAGAHVTSLFSRHPDDPITRSGVFGERGRRPIAYRFGRRRVDLKHAWLDPILVLAPWVVAAVVVFRIARVALVPASRR